MNDLENKTIDLHRRIKACSICKDFLPNTPKPIFEFNSKSKILIIGQAPGRIVHEKEIPFDDKSGNTLRDWLCVTREEFYNPDNFAIVPMGFCYPGKGKTGGDAPPRKECAPQWHKEILGKLNNIKLIILVGAYAQNYYLKDTKKKNLTETVRNFEEYYDFYFPIVHPSPLNYRWHTKNKWFVEDVVPILQFKIKEILNK